MLSEDDAVRTVRLGLLAHDAMVAWLAFLSTWIGIAFVLTGAPAFVENWFSPWSRVALGFLAFLPAVLTLTGVMLGSRQSVCGWWAKVMGLLGQAVWYLIMAGIYVGLIIAEGGLDVLLPGEPLQTSSGRAYVVLIYVALLGLAAIPLVVTIRLGRPQR